MEIVDAQVHAPSIATRPDDREDPTQDALRIEATIAAMDAVGVHAAVVHDPPRLCEAYVASDPARFAAIVRLDPATPHIDDVLGVFRARPGMLGIRIVATSPMRPDSMRMFASGGYDPWFAAAERHGVPICLYVAGKPEMADPIARRHPQLRLIVDHLGLLHPPRGTPGLELFEPLPRVLDLARYPNVAVKFTGVPHISAAPYPFAELWPYLHRLIERFGPERLMWGSDFTRVRRHHTYAEAISFLRDTSELSEDDKCQMLSASLRRWMGWPRAVA